ncbi:multidrug transporter [Microlunatus endophyticus]|uniref:Multidrug transporter n=1 Tax=Microlunatus endophyticus TaxID=1716077 RepID=A0A917W123_9ACTN|nr:DMT family transporter [Microlunatus endophyticus]GGL49169.1 multidrug transporter [Microlunatus endophyticus]
MAVVFALASALSYGISDYLAGVTSRDWDFRLVTAGAQVIGLLTAIVAVLLFPGAGPAGGPILWGAISGIGSAVGVLALYRGLAVGSMNVVAPLCGVLTSVIPAVVGILLGNHLSAIQVAGIVLALPAVLLVSRQPGPAAGSRAGGAAVLGLLAGAGFGLLFVALSQAGTRNGAWPLLSGQSVVLLLVLPIAIAGLGSARTPQARAVLSTTAAGLLSGAANILYLVATGFGELAIVGVLSSLYPAGTVLIARFRLAEHWSRTQIIGMLAAVLAVILVVLG